MNPTNLAIFQDVQSYAVGMRTMDVAAFSKLDFYKAVYLMLKETDLYKENNYSYFFSKLNIKGEQTKQNLLASVKQIAVSEGDLQSWQLDGALRSMRAILEFGIKDNTKRQQIFQEVWSLINPLLFHVYQKAAA
jgi:hypothetical protein